jgi:hypothetical protein
VLGDAFYFTPGNQISKAYALEKVVDLSAQVFPQVVGQADFTILTVPSTTTLRGIHRFVDGVDNLGDENRISASPQVLPQTAYAEVCK